MIGSQIIAGRRIRFPDHEYVAGPFTDDEAWGHVYDGHSVSVGFNRVEVDAAHFAAHEGVPVTRVFVTARATNQVQAYLGFGAEYVRTEMSDISGFVTVIVDVPDEHAQYLIDRLHSGLYGCQREEISA